MREYTIKRKNKIDQERLKKIMEKNFGSVKVENEYFISSYGSLDLIKAKLRENKLFVETQTNKNKEFYEETIKRFNNFLEEATGYSAKERKKLLMKE